VRLLSRQHALLLTSNLSPSPPTFESICFHIFNSDLLIASNTIKNCYPTLALKDPQHCLAAGGDTRELCAAMLREFLGVVECGGRQERRVQDINNGRGIENGFYFNIQSKTIFNFNIQSKIIFSSNLLLLKNKIKMYQVKQPLTQRQ
jgi:hypothetical protein